MSNASRLVVLGEAETAQRRLYGLAEVLNALIAAQSPPGRVAVARGY